MTQQKTCPFKDLREAVALVPQKPFLFNTTVRENIELEKNPPTPIVAFRRH